MQARQRGFTAEEWDFVLSLFGSVLRDDFDPQRSEVDVVAEFEPGR